MSLVHLLFPRRAELDALSGQLDTARGRIRVLEADLRFAKGDLAAFRSKMAADKLLINELQAELRALEAKYGSLS